MNAFYSVRKFYEIFYHIREGKRNIKTNNLNFFPLPLYSNFQVFAHFQLLPSDNSLNMIYKNKEKKQSDTDMFSYLSPFSNNDLKVYRMFVNNCL